jgi:CheY-like chemotaxis protein
MSDLVIAIVDDDEISLELMINILETELNATVFSFTRSKFAREFLLQQNEDSLHLVISDLVMPEYDGVELLRTFRQAGLNIPFLFMTAYASRQTVLDAKKLGAVGYMVKPISKDELIKKVKSVITK